MFVLCENRGAIKRQASCVPQSPFSDQDTCKCLPLSVRFSLDYNTMESRKVSPESVKVEQPTRCPTPGGR
jgi:hypothetical protein